MFRTSRRGQSARKVDGCLVGGHNQCMKRALSTALYACGLGLLGLGAYEYFHPLLGSVPSASVTIDEPDRHFSTFPAGTKQAVVFRLHNAASSAARVVGLAPC